MNKQRSVRKIIAAVTSVVLVVVMGLTICGCSDGKTAGTSEFYRKLSALDGVSSIEQIEQTDAAFAEKYMITFTQPLDWNDPQAGTFEQRVEIGYQSDDSINCYQVDGYCLYDKILGSTDIFKMNDSSELAQLALGNFINIEYRFFGDSVPEGLSHDNTDYWEYLTVENAAKDFEAIIESLSTILTDAKIFSGSSKGGFTTNTMAYYYPDLCDAYVSYVAPLCNGIEDPATIKNVYETIGNEGYSENEAAEMREKMLDFQVFCIENREELQQMCWDSASESGYKYRDFVTKEILYDMEVMNFGAQFWQYGSDFSLIDQVTAMPDTTEEEHTALIESAFQLLISISSLDNWDTNYAIFPYYVQAVTEMGENLLDFSYLREAVIEKTGKDMLAITEDMQSGLLANFMFTEEQKEIFQYDGTIREELIAWSETTQANVVMIYGGCDVWYPVRIPETDNPHVHVYVNDAGSHSTLITSLAEEDQNECIELIAGWIGK